MPGIQFTIDPDAAPLELTSVPGVGGFDVFSPVRVLRGAVDKQWAGSIDTEGELPAGGRTGNAEIGLRLRIWGALEADFRVACSSLAQKVRKLQAEGGVLRVTMPDASIIDWEVRNVTGAEWLLENRFAHRHRTEDELSFAVAPFGVGEEYHAGTFTFPGAPERVLQVEIPDVPGDAPARARVRLTSPDDQRWVRWGRESRYYSDADTAELFYPAAEFTPQDGAAATTATIDGVAGVSVVRQGSLISNWRPVLSTELAGVGHLTHEGIYEVLAWIHMPAANTGQVEVKLEYGVGQLTRRTSNTPLQFLADHSLEGKVVLASLGQVFLRRAQLGAHRWIGQVAARSTVAGDDLDVLGLGLIPLGDGNGSVEIQPSLDTPLSVAIRDEFNQSAGNLHGKAIAAAASVSGPRSPGTAADDAGTGSLAWSNPSSVLTENGVVADAWSGGSPGISHYLKATNFGFALPVGATVDGIVAEIKRGADGFGDQVIDNHIFLVKAGAIQGVGNHAGAGFWPAGSLAYRSYGSPNDLWSNTWTQAQINASGFGIAISVQHLNGSRAQIDHVRFTVYYTDATGQTWATTGDATDIAVEAVGHTAQRSEISDADTLTGRYAIAGSTVYSESVVTIAAKRSVADVGSSQSLLQAALARYTDTNNWLMGGRLITGSAEYAFVGKRVAGTYTTLGTVAVSTYIDWRTLWLHVTSRGLYFLWSATSIGSPTLLLAGHDPVLATGATLDDGKIGFYDAKTGATAVTRNYDGFAGWVPSSAAVLFGDLNLELRSDAAEREALGGGIWEELVPRGDYVALDPAGLEGRVNRLAIAAARVDPALMGVSPTPSDLTVDVFVTPRYQAIPE